MVLDFRNCGDLLNAWAAVRAQIVRGEIRGLAVCVKDACGVERVFFAGDYRDEPAAALRVSLSMSWELTRQGSEVPDTALARIAGDKKEG